MEICLWQMTFSRQISLLILRPLAIALLKFADLQG